jgi:hypothetical protein
VQDSREPGSDGPADDLSPVPAFLSASRSAPGRPADDAPASNTAVRPVATPHQQGSRIRSSLRLVLTLLVSVILGAALIVGLVVSGLFLLPTVGVAAYAVDAPPRRPPIIPPSVPPGAREEWAIWTYVDKINQAWGKDWPQVIAWFEELDERYPGNPMVFDKLYAAYIEDGRTLQFQGDLQGARRRYEQASRHDPDRGIAETLLDELDAREAAGR